MIPDDCVALFAPACAADLSGVEGLVVAFCLPLALVALPLVWVVWGIGREYWRGD